MKEDFNKFLSLSPAALHILLALLSEDRHGYGIMQEVARQSENRCKLGPGTLYDNLEKLLNQGIVEESTRRSLTDDPRRRASAGHGDHQAGRRGSQGQVALARSA
jgi:DNA-binding PadR family transcriptional regulator